MQFGFAVQSGRFQSGFGSRSIGFFFRVERDQFRAESNLIERGKVETGTRKEEWGQERTKRVREPTSP